MISRLLKKNIPGVRLACYAVANILGLAILLTAVKFYADIRSGNHDNISEQSDFLVLQKPVPLLSALGGNDRTRFSEDEIHEIESQPWAVRTGRFTAADFSVSAAVQFAGRGMSTALFFESLPDNFVDTDTAGWTFDPSRPEIPILLPRDYFSLYNFGFAASRDMPQLSEDLIRNIPLRIGISGNGHSDMFEGRIAGLSSRLNTIAVPQKFMDWANCRYGSPSGSSTGPSRLIVETSSPGDPAVADWLGSHGIETSGDKLVSGRAAYIAGIASSLTAAIGVIISLLSVAMLMLSIFLIIEKNRETIRNLTLLGYTPAKIASFYNSIILKLNLSVTAAAIVLTLLAASLWTPLLEAAGFGGSGIWPVIICGAAVMGAVTALSIATVRRLTNRTAI